MWEPLADRTAMRREESRGRRRRTHHQWPILRISFLGDPLAACSFAFSRNGETQWVAFPVEANDFPSGYVNCIKLISRMPHQILQLEACVLESGNIAPPKGRAIGEFLEHIIFAIHRSPIGRLFFRRYGNHNHPGCPIHRLNRRDQIRLDTRVRHTFVFIVTTLAFWVYTHSRLLSHPSTAFLVGDGPSTNRPILPSKPKVAFAPFRQSAKARKGIMS
jgi:hypothetical protein